MCSLLDLFEVSRLYIIVGTEGQVLATCLHIFHHMLDAELNIIGHPAIYFTFLIMHVCSM